MMIENKRRYEVEVGVDVSKATLDVCAGGRIQKFPNTRTGAARLLSKLCADSDSCRVSCEATGTYSHLLIKACLQKGVPISQLNPLQVKHYIRSSGKLAKTDAIDAAKIREFAMHHAPVCIGDSWLRLEQLRQYSRRMKALIKERASAKASLDKYDEAWIRRELEVDIRRLTRKIERYEVKLDEMVALQPDLLAKRDLLETVKGVGRRTSMCLLLHMPELGSLNRREVATLTGLAPIHNESGKKNGARKVSGGRRDVRCALYMAAVVASCRNNQLSDFYLGLKERGKSGRVAIIAVARKLVIYLNTLLKNAPAQI